MVEKVAMALAANDHFRGPRLWEPQSIERRWAELDSEEQQHYLGMASAATLALGPVVEAARSLAVAVETFRDYGGNGIERLTDTEWLRLRPRIQERMVAVADALKAEGSG